MLQSIRLKALQQARLTNSTTIPRSVELIDYPVRRKNVADS